MSSIFEPNFSSGTLSFLFFTSFTIFTSRTGDSPFLFVIFGDSFSLSRLKITSLTLSVFFFPSLLTSLKSLPCCSLIPFSSLTTGTFFPLCLSLVFRSFFSSLLFNCDPSLRVLKSNVPLESSFPFSRAVLIVFCSNHLSSSLMFTFGFPFTVFASNLQSGPSVFFSPKDLEYFCSSCFSIVFISFFNFSTDLPVLFSFFS